MEGRPKSPEHRRVPLEELAEYFGDRILNVGLLRAAGNAPQRGARHAKRPTGIETHELGPRVPVPLRARPYERLIGHHTEDYIPSVKPAEYFRERRPV